MKSNRRQFMAASAVSVLGTLACRVSGAQQADSAIAFQRQVGPINWYCELRGSGAPVVLIPSGEGDCGSFAKVAALLSTDFRVLTFDMPGFSRSSDPPNFSSYSISQAAGEVAALVRALELYPATVYGCSSGGQIALRLASEHSSLVRRAVVHEVAPAAPVPASSEAPLPPALSPNMTDTEIALACKSIFRNRMNADADAWDALGVEFHQRLERNYVTWVRRYFGLPDMRMPTPEELHRRPVTWTVGALSNPAAFANNLAAAEAAGIAVGRLMCKHFPQVSIPTALADHIGKAARA